MSKSIKTTKDVIQSVRDGWEAETIVKNAVTPDGESVRSLISKHNYFKGELEDVERGIAKFAKVVSNAINTLDESDDAEDWGLASELSYLRADLAGELGYTGYSSEEGWVNSEY